MIQYCAVELYVLYISVHANVSGFYQLGHLVDYVCIFNRKSDTVLSDFRPGGDVPSSSSEDGKFGSYVSFLGKLLNFIRPRRGLDGTVDIQGT